VAVDAARLLADGSLTPTWKEGKKPEKSGPSARPQRSEEEQAAERERRRALREQGREKGQGDTPAGDDEPR
jgi:hypothetical protein